ncbi:hypothetical protein [Hoeflea sp. TYP-13]|uniref:preATP grasp domain-containing protein n=1 Tax=Hoeflea sp. TYP-13 TaxID=3230023 RepID=UPI0034C5FD44
MLPQAARQRVEKIAGQVLRREPGLSRADYFGPNVRVGMGAAPHILIGDKSEIRLLAPAGQDPLEYRIALLARDGDLVVLAAERNRAYEGYLRDLLELNDLNVLRIPPPESGLPRPSAYRCLEDNAIFNRLLDIVRQDDCVTLLSFISTGLVWKLAKRLSDRSGRTVLVAGPPPNLTQRVNDKLWFAEIVKTVLGASATPPVYSAFGPAALVGRVRKLAKKWEKLVIKVPDSAGSAGNFPLYTDTIKDLSAKDLYRYLFDTVSEIHQQDAYPLMVEVWDCNVLASPSVQLWIPDKEDGDPVIEGIYDQTTAGPGGKFVGATSARLDPEHDKQVCAEALTLGLLFQNLGYFGRCSFDAVLAGVDRESAQLHWIECNGRWGGVSLPMTFLNRIFSVETMPDYVIWQHSDLDFPAMPFTEALTRLDSGLYKAGSDPEGIIFTSPTGIETGTGLQMIALGWNEKEAMNLANRAYRCLTDSSER